MEGRARRVFGLETEYAVFGLANDGSRIEPHVVAACLLQRAFDRLAHLPGSRHDLFLANGARFYVDEGSHPEMCTPECEDPKDVVRLALACDRILAGLATPSIDDTGVTFDVHIHTSNVDYSGSQTTWGCHESYMHRAKREQLGRHLLPHLVSRLVYTGSGGFVSTSPGIDFALSPRTFHLTQVTSGTSTHERGIFHGNKHSLCGGDYRRLHLLCGESLRSHTAAWLKVGVTALIIAMIEAGVPVATGVELASPLRAMRAFAADSSCTLRVKLLGGGRASAIEIQRHYLAQAERHLGARFMPDWAEEVCACWRDVLNGLAESPAALAGRLDWPTKLALYQSLAEEAGFAGAELRSLSRRLRAQTPLRRVSPWPEVGRLRRALGVGASKPNVVDERDSHDRLRAFADLRSQLFEMDARFGQLGGPGIFTLLERSGALAHRVEGIDDIERAMTDAPGTGRAHLRGRMVRDLAGQSGLICTWSRVRDLHRRRWLDLENPFEAKERWSPIPTDDLDEILSEI